MSDDDWDYDSGPDIAAQAQLDDLRERAETAEARVRELETAANELLSWDWLHLLDDSIHSRDVRADVERLKDVLDAPSRLTPPISKDDST